MFKNRPDYSFLQYIYLIVLIIGTYVHNQRDFVSFAFRILEHWPVVLAAGFFDFVRSAFSVSSISLPTDRQCLCFVHFGPLLVDKNKMNSPSKDKQQLKKCLRASLQNVFFRVKILVS